MPLELPPQAHHPAPPWRHLHPAANTNTNTSGHSTGADISNDVTFLCVRCTQRYLHISSPWRWRACRSWTCAAGWWEWERMAGPERRDWSSPPTGCPGTPAGSEWRDASATSWPAQEPDRERGGGQLRCSELKSNKKVNYIFLLLGSFTRVLYWAFS